MYAEGHSKRLRAFERAPRTLVRGLREIDATVRARFVTKRCDILKPLFRSRFERSESTKSTCGTSRFNHLNLSDCISIT